MDYGSKPADGGNLILEECDRQQIIGSYPQSKPFIFSYVGAEDYINGKKRYWIVFPILFEKSCS